MRAKELARLLAQDADSVCRHLLPAGKRQGNEWVAGSVHGDEGKSCKVVLSGDKAGIWSDFAEGESGDLLNLWVAARGVSILQAMDEAKNFLGVAEPKFHGYNPPRHRPQKPRCRKPEGEVLEWLHGRGLDDDTLEAYRIAATDREVVFPFLRDGELWFCKLRDIHDKSRMRVVENSVACLFGWQAIPSDDRSVVICEGEIDALSWYQMGYPALSVPNGAQGFNWIEHEFDRLERFDRIYIAFDADEAGQKGAPKLADRLGIERCYIVDTSPHKDANDLLLAGTSAEDCIACSQPLSPVELKDAYEYTDRVIREFDPNSGIQVGFEAPWDSAEGKVKFRRGELTIISGQNGHGKSQAVGQLILAAMAQGEKVCIFSGEMKPERVLYRLVRQATALETGYPTDEFIRATMEWMRGKLWIFDLTGTAKVKRLLEIFQYARARFGVTCFVVDSMLTCDIDSEDNEAQRRFVEQVRDFKNETDSHVFLVTHSRKLMNEDRPGGKMDVRGSGAITDLADNVTIWWRNKPKEAELHKAKLKRENTDEIKNKPDAFWIWDKQRNGDWEGRFYFWFHQNSYTYQSRPGKKPSPLVSYQQDATMGESEEGSTPTDTDDYRTGETVRH